jgi:hypothetical protein
MGRWLMLDAATAYAFKNGKVIERRIPAFNDVCLLGWFHGTSGLLLTVYRLSIRAFFRLPPFNDWVFYAPRFSSLVPA